MAAFTLAWLKASAEQLAFVFVVSVVATLSAGGVFSVSTVHAAVVVAGAAVISALSSILATFVHSGEANPVTATRKAVLTP